MAVKITKFSQVVDIEMEQGSVFRPQLIYQDENEVLVDLTGYDAEMQIKDEIGGTLIHTMNVANGGITLGGVNGTIDLYISDETTAAFTFDCAVYDLELEEPGGDRFRLIQGGITLDKEVTT